MKTEIRQIDRATESDRETTQRQAGRER
eukprot:COSAG03_NODE_18374_length_356_cov_1.097276_1_plen_27_part_10